MSLSNHAAFWALLSATAISIFFFCFGVELRLTFLLGIRPYISGLIPRRPFTPKMTSLHIEPTSPGNTSVAIYIGDSKIYLDTTGFKPTRTYLLKVKDPYRTVSAVPAPILCEASVFNEALHLLTTHSIAQRLREPALSAIFPVDPPLRSLVPVRPSQIHGSPDPNPATGRVSCQLSGVERQRFLQVGQNMSAY